MKINKSTLIFCVGYTRIAVPYSVRMVEALNELLENGVLVERDWQGHMTAASKMEDNVNISITNQPIPPIKQPEETAENLVENAPETEN